MRTPAIPSIDQLLVLLAVAEAGSFTGAAKRLGRAVSAISYAIDTLEESGRFSRTSLPVSISARTIGSGIPAHPSPARRSLCLAA
jgi:hypothetical protein